MVSKVSGTNNTTAVPSRSPTASASEGQFTRFDSLAAQIKPESIIALALRIRREWTGNNQEKLRQYQSQDYNCTIISPPEYGTRNLFHTLEFSDGLKWILRIPYVKGPHYITASSPRLFRSEAMTTQFIQKLTSIPIPEIYNFDETSNNEIKSPYILMKFMEGFTVSEKWFDSTGPTPLEERRLRILDTVAAAMSQFWGFQFDKIGSLRFDSDGTFSIDVCKVADEATDTEPIFRKIGPFSSSREYFTSLLNAQMVPRDPFCIGIHKIIRLMIDSTPSPSPGESETFVLAHPDFSSKNFLVSEDGTLTGILNWDNIHTLPRPIGYARYPSWITRDWNPLMYGYGIPTYPQENSPEELESYRRRYAKRMKICMPNAADFTTRSHLFEAVWTAARSLTCSHHIVLKILTHQLLGREGREGDVSLYLYATAIAATKGALRKDDEQDMIRKFHSFFYGDSTTHD